MKQSQLLTWIGNYMKLTYAFLNFLSLTPWTLIRGYIQVWSWFAIIMEVKLNMGVNPNEQKSTWILWEPNQHCMPSSESTSSWLAHKFELIAPSLSPVVGIHIHPVCLSLKSGKYYLPHCEQTMVPNCVQSNWVALSLPDFLSFTSMNVWDQATGNQYPWRFILFGRKFLVASQKMRKLCP